MKNVLETMVIEDNNPNMLLCLCAIFAGILILYSLLSIPLSNRFAKKKEHAAKLIRERHEKIEAENERRRKLEAKKEIDSIY